MTLKTFWTIFLKIFGIYLIWQVLIILPSFFSTLIFIGGEDKISLFTTLSAIIFIISFFVLIVRYSIFKTDRVIEKLHLEKGFPDEKLEINIHRSSLLTIATIVLGGLMIADGLPLLIYNTFYYIQRSDALIKFSDNRVTPYLVSNLLKVLLGYFMVSDSRLIVNFVERKRKKNVVNADDVTE
jgi:hypothetical protein